MKLATIMRKISLPLVILLGVIFIFFVNTNEGFATCTAQNCVRSGGTFYNGICYGSCNSGYGIRSNTDCKFKGTQEDATFAKKPYIVDRPIMNNNCR